MIYWSDSELREYLQLLRPSINRRCSREHWPLNLHKLLLPTPYFPVPITIVLSWSWWSADPLSLSVRNLKIPSCSDYSLFSCSLFFPACVSAAVKLLYQHRWRFISDRDISRCSLVPPCFSTVSGCNDTSPPTTGCCDTSLSQGHSTVAPALPGSDSALGVNRVKRKLTKLEMEKGKTVSRSTPKRICRTAPYPNVPVAQTRTSCSGLTLPLAHRLW
jgi:hypothetical protein